MNRIATLVIAFVAFTLSASPSVADLESRQAVIGARIWGEIGFIENRGQVDDRVRFYLREGLRTTWVTDDGLTFTLRRRKANEVRQGSSNVPPVPVFEETVVSTSLVSPHHGRVVEGVDRNGAPISYHRRSRSISAGSFQRLTYEQAWEGIDLHLYRKDGELEEEFTLHPGAKPQTIRFAVEGHERIEIAADGSLVIGTELGTLTLDAPFAYQTVGGEQIEVPVRYRMIGDSGYGFEVGAYDEKIPLIIDPTVTYATYLGGLHDDIPVGVAFDSSNNMYITGYTASEDFPVTGDAFQDERKDLGQLEYDGFIVKLTAGNAIEYASFLGGNGNDYLYSIALDGSKNVYVAGQVNSSDWPVTMDAFQPTFGGVFDVVIAKLSPDLSAILYSSYLGGSGSGGDSGNEFARLEVNAAGEMFLVGSTGSVDFPTTSGAFQATYGGGTLDCFVTKFSSNGQLAFSSFIGGNGHDRFYTTTNQIRSDGRLVVVGVTDSTDFPFSPNAFDTTLSGSRDAFVALVSADGSSLLYSTLIGGNGSDNPWASYVDATGAVIMAGTTTSTDYPATDGAFSSDFFGSTTGFVTKIKLDGNGPVFSTAIGPVSSQSGLIGNSFPGAALDVASDGRILFSAQASGSSFPTTSGALQTSAKGGVDSVFSILSPDGGSLIYSSYLGGSSTDGTNAAVFDKQGNVVLLGGTDSIDFPVTEDAFQGIYALGQPEADGSDAYIVRVALPQATPTPGPTPTPGFEPAGAVSPTLGGNGGSVTLSVAGNGFTAQSKIALVSGATRREADLTSVSDDGTLAVGLIDLRDLSPGAYDVQVTNSSGGGSLSSPGAFTVTAGGAPKLWLRTVGRPTIRNGFPSKYFVNFGNSGEVDAYHVYMFVRVSANASVSALYDVRPVPSAESRAEVDRSSYPKVATDPETGEKYLVLLIPSIPAGTSRSLPLEVTVAETGQFEINASFGPVGFLGFAEMDELLSTPVDAQALAREASTGAARSSSRSLYNCFQGASDVITSVIAVKKIFKVASDAAKFQKAAADALRVTERLTMNEVFGDLAKDIGKGALDGFGKSKALAATASAAGLVSSPVNLIELGGDIALTALQLFPPTAVFATGVDFVIKVTKFVKNGGFKDCIDLTDDIIDIINPDARGSIDPNDKAGPQGAAAGHWVQGDRALQYIVNFQNLPTATLPAQIVTITDSLDASKLDLSTFKFGTVGFVDQSATPVAVDGQFTTDIDLAGQGLKVRVTGSLDDTGLVTWTFTTLDAGTGLAPEDPTVGFLAPNAEGRVLFTIEPKAGLSNGTTVSNMARIVFDNNAPIDTPLWTNTLAAPTNQKIAPRPARAALKDGGVSRPAKVVIRNPAKKGGESILVSEVSVSDPFVLTANGCSGRLIEPKKSCKVSVAYNPSNGRKSKGALTVTSNAKGGVLSVPLSGRGKPVSLKVKPKKPSFGTVSQGATGAARKITLRNPAPVPYSVSSAASDGSDFAVTEDLCTGILAARSSCTVSMSFTPSRKGKIKGSLRISSSDGRAQKIGVTGKGR